MEIRNCKRRWQRGSNLGTATVEFKYDNFKKFQRRLLYYQYNGKCAYCGCHLEYDELTIDHVIPKVKGGKNSKKNYRACCRDCNEFKGQKTMKEFRIAIEEKPTKEIQEKYKDWDGVFYFERMH